MRHIRDTTFKLTSILALGATVAMAAACGDDDDEFEDQALIRAVHVAPGAPDVQVFINQAEVPLASIGFGESSALRDLEPGTYRIDIVPAGGSLANPIESFDVTLQPNTANVLAIGGSPDDLTVRLFEEPLEIDDDERQVQLINLAQDAGPITLYALPAGADPQVLTDAVPFGEASGAVMFQEGIQALALDTNADNVPDVRFDLPQALEGGTLANLYAVRNAQNQISLLVQTNVQTLTDLSPVPVTPGGDMTTSVRVINTTADATGLSFFADGTQIAENVGPLMTTNFREIDAGTYDITVGPTADNPLAVIPDVTLGAGATTTIVVFGSAAALQAEVIQDDLTNIPADMARVRLIHTAAGVGEVDVYDVSGATPVLLIEDLAFGEVSDALLVDPVERRVGVDTDDDGVVDVTFTTLAPEPGTNTNIYVTFDAEGNPVLLAQSGGVVMTLPDP